MANSPSANVAADWASLLAEGKPFPPQQAVELIQQLAEEVSQLHASGQFHGEIDLKAVAVSADLGPFLQRRDRDSVVTLNWGEWGEFIQELQKLIPPELPPEIHAAQRKLQTAGIDIDPRQIDVCQLGALFCRLLTSDSAASYLRSLRVKSKVPDELRPVLEKMLGCDGQSRYPDAVALVSALSPENKSEHIVVQMPVTELLPVEGLDSSAKQPPVSRATSDTTPSFVAKGDGGSDTSVRPGGLASAASSSGAARTSEPPLPFARLGHYEMVGRIGRGGMGDVYRGYERALDRVVAIKVLPSDLARNDDFVRRFRSEATAVAKLNHPNIVPIHFIGHDQGHHFYVMQFVDGESLAERLERQGRLSVTETLPIVEQALAGLAAAHQAGMVHRDIKPGNILLDKRTNRALLADFGLVKSLEASQNGSERTATGVVMGTADYISPEQGRGQAVDCRSDLYSLGVLIYRLLTGRLPFEADNPTALIFLHVYELPPRLQERAPDIPDSLAAIVDRLLEKSPDDRHQTAEEVLADLKAFQAGMPVPVRPKAAPQAPGNVLELAGESADPASRYSVVLRAEPQTGWWTRITDRVRSFVVKNTPEALEHLQGTQLQMDGAVAASERRERELRQHAKEADSVLVELRAQLRAQQQAAEAAGQLADTTDDPAKAEQARDEQRRGERAASDLERQVAEHEEQLEPLRLQLAQVQARVHQLRNQRDILNARLVTARAQQGTPGSRPARRVDPRFIVFIVGCLGVSGILFLTVMLKNMFRTERQFTRPAGYTTTTTTETKKGSPIETSGKPVPTGGPRELLIRAVVDGRDDLRFFPGVATWEHLGESQPKHVEINDVYWNPSQSERLSNSEGTFYLSSAVSFAKPELIQHKGRAPVTLVPEGDQGFCLQFNDPEPGADEYELTVRFHSGRDPGPAVSPDFPGSSPLLSAPFSRSAAEARQRDWASYLKSPVAMVRALQMKFMLVPPGSFTMGFDKGDLRAMEAVARGPVSNFGEANGQLMTSARIPVATLQRSFPSHRVSITRPFYLSQTEVTRGQFRAFMQETGYAIPKGEQTWETPGFTQQDNHPMVQVRRQDAIAFCEWLSAKEGVKCRLPTEAEWEYACRAGTTSIWMHGYTYEGMYQVGNISDGVPREKASLFKLGSVGEKVPGFVLPDGYRFTAPVGQYRLNAFGLLDMHGNVAEWMGDGFVDYSSSAVVDPKGNSAIGLIRGGSWYTPIWTTTSGSRLDWDVNRGTSDIGFRVVREIEPPEVAAKRAAFPSGLNHWWTGDNAGRDSVGDMHATIVGTVGNAAAVSGSGYQFSGVMGALKFGDIEFDHSFTLAAWIKPDSAIRDGLSCVFFRGDDRGGQDPLIVAVTGYADGVARLRFYLESAEGQAAEVAAAVKLQQFQHIAAVYDETSKKMSLYINGKLATSADVPFSPAKKLRAPMNPGFAIGNSQHPEANNLAFDGVIDEVQMYSRALDAADVAKVHAHWPSGSLIKF